ncbi:pyridoxal phosphate-dependent aminotransferase [Rhabdaerophilum sp.]|uniref:pyridoxal phosphate-dependent aminotransferase n=1 Tax=Rhabdaerophilum sp. TaxID=2717341 RepID=UPI0038D36054
MLSPERFPLRPEALAAPSSGIVEVFDYGRNRPGLLPLWVGEGDRATPSFIIEAASRSLAAGETFYTHQAGIPPLREAIAAYLTRISGQKVGAERIFVTNGGMHALQIAVRMTAGSGDEVIVPTPAWPNFRGALEVAGATTREVPMRFGNSGWQLEIDDIARAITPRTRALCINSPANPTGWTATLDEVRAMLALARKHGLWIIADEIYGQFFHDAPRAPSFRDLMNEEDRILFVQTFSKNWAMTGWRMGWLEAPPALAQVIINLIQYSSSGTPVFAQRAGIAALEGGDSFIVEQVRQARLNRDQLITTLSAVPGFRLAPPPGAFYLFFGVEGATDTRALAFDLIDHAGVGLAPGTAFGTGGEGFLRLCYLRKGEDVAEAANCLAARIRARAVAHA